MRVQVEKIDSLQTSLLKDDHCTVIAKWDLILAEKLRIIFFFWINLFSMFLRSVVSSSGATMMAWDMMRFSYLRPFLDRRHCSIHTRHPPLCYISLPYSCSCSGSLDIIRSAPRKSSTQSTVVVPWIAHLGFEVSGGRSRVQGAYSSGMTWRIAFQILFETLRMTCEPSSIASEARAYHLSSQQVFSFAESLKYLFRISS